MEQRQFAQAVEQVVRNERTERLVPGDLSRRFGIPVKNVERMLDRMVTEGNLELDSDDDGNLFYFMPGVGAGGVFNPQVPSAQTASPTGPAGPPENAWAAGGYPQQPPHAAPGAPGPAYRPPAHYPTHGPTGPAPGGGYPTGGPGPYGPPPGYQGQPTQQGYGQQSYRPQPGPYPQGPPPTYVPPSYGQPGQPPAYGPANTYRAGAPGYPPPGYAPQGGPPAGAYPGQTAQGQPGYGQQPWTQNGYNQPQHGAPGYNGAPGYYGHNALVPANQTNELRSPSTAALLSTFFPGAGQLYNGQVGKGMAFFMATVVSLVFGPLFVIPYVWSIVDSYNTSRRINAYGMLPP